MEFLAWRATARALLAAGIEPADVHWAGSHQVSLFAPPVRETGHQPVQGGGSPRVPARLLPMLEDVFCHRGERRLALMYRVLWRAVHGEPALLDDTTDDDVLPFLQMQRDVRRDSHKMTAFVRFREVRGDTDGEKRWLAWYEPSHHILRRMAPFFVKRFGPMAWTIATPDGTATWDRATLRFLPTDASHPPPSEDAGEDLWLAYYRSIFNPARLNVRAMQKEMPQKYWRNLPEARLIPGLIAGAARQAGTMVERAPRVITPPAPRVGAARGATTTAAESKVQAGREDLADCRRCPLWERATQAVRGAGPADARLMLVGEQPGDEEDLQGTPFIGPAGKLLRRALAEAQIAIDQVYVTNAVKHFSWEPRGKRRIHKTPGQRAIEACRSWLDDEIARVRPAVIVALGATALQALVRERLAISGARASILRHHGGAQVIATYHPAAVLRGPDAAAGREIRAALVADLRRAAACAGYPSPIPENGRPTPFV
ncbi:MAG: UdgX family uracil-DNA binding protein [Casimicrobiaceae bacterium]